MPSDYCTWLKYCMDTFWIFECHFERRYTAKQLGKTAQSASWKPLSPSLTWSTMLVVLHELENNQLSSLWSWNKAIAATYFRHVRWIKLLLVSSWPIPISMYCGQVFGGVSCKVYPFQIQYSGTSELRTLRDHIEVSAIGRCPLYRECTW